MITLHYGTNLALTPRQKYIVDLWDEKLRMFGEAFVGFSYLSPPVLLEILWDELSQNKLRSEPLKSLILQKLLDAARKDPSVKGSALEHSFLALTEEMKLGWSPLLQEMCANTRSEINHPEYFDRVLNAISAVASGESHISAQDLAHLQRLLSTVMIALLNRGFHPRSLASIMINVLSEVVIQNDFVSTRFPIEYFELASSSDALRFPVPQKSADPAAVKLTQMMAALTFRDRLMALGCYLKRQPKTRKYLFNVLGLYGRESFNVGDIEFYSPLENPKIESLSGDQEMFGQSAAIMPINALVSAYVVDDEYGYGEAQERLDKALDVVRFSSNSVLPIRVNPLQYICLTPAIGLTSYHTSGTGNPDYLSQLSAHSGDLSRLIAADGFAYTNRVQLHERLTVALHWFRKAVDAERPEDQFLFYWVVLEQLLSDQNANVTEKGHRSAIGPAVSIIPDVYAFIDAFAFVPDLFNYVERLADFTLSFHRLEVNDPLVAALLEGFPAGTVEQVNVERLISFLGEVPPSLLHDRLEQGLLRVNDKKALLRFLSEVEEHIRDEVKVFYWIRNRMVHDASFAFASLPYFLQRIRNVVANIMGLAVRRAPEFADTRPPYMTLVSIQASYRGLKNDLNAPLPMGYSELAKKYWGRDIFSARVAISSNGTATSADSGG